MLRGSWIGPMQCISDDVISPEIYPQNIVQWDCSTAPHFQWRVEGSGDTRQVVARHSGQCFNIEGGSQAVGSNLLQDTHVGSPTTSFVSMSGTATDHGTICGVGNKWSHTVESSWTLHRWRQSRLCVCPNLRYPVTHRCRWSTVLFIQRSHPLELDSLSGEQKTMVRV